MESDDLDFQLSAWPPAVPAEFGWCLSLGLLFAVAGPKPLTTTIELAHGALKGARALHHLPSPASPETILFASRVFAHGYKLSKTLNLRRPEPLSFLYKRLKPYFGAIDLVKYARSPVTDCGFLGLGLVKYGYKISKNFFRVLEGFAGVELDSAVRNGFDSLGLMIKAVKVAQEVGRMAGEGRPERCAMGYDGEFACGIRVSGVERLDLGGRGYPDVRWEGKRKDEEEKKGARLDEVFFLSLPLDERLILFYCSVPSV